MRMNRGFCVVFTLYIANVIAYHDPDLNYHINQLQNLQNCGDNGYNYPVPAIQLTTSGVKHTAPNAIRQPILTAPTYTYSKAAGYSANIAYQAPAVQRVTYAQPTIAYPQQPLSVPPTGYATRNEAHGYATSAGLSTYTGQARTVTPLATYAQAPIIAKITAAPLIARFSAAPAKALFLNQNIYSSQGSITTNTGGPVVSQVYAAPSSGYATSPALRVQTSLPNVQTANYVGTAISNAAISQYQAQTVGQYAAQPVTHFTTAPIIQTAAPAIAQFSVPAYSHGQRGTTGVSQYSSSVAHGASGHYSAGGQISQVSPVAHYSAPAQLQSSAVSHYAAPALHTPSPGIAKNVHSEFIENYDAHPRYEFEYRVHDPHTGDIKQQQEQRDGEVVKGQYSLVEPDGSVRTVDYVADWETGFHANVRNSKQNL